MKVKELIEELKIAEKYKSILDYDVFAEVNNQSSDIDVIQIEDDLTCITLKEANKHELSEDKMFDKIYNEIYVGDHILFVSQDALHMGSVVSFEQFENTMDTWKVSLKVYDNSTREFILSNNQFVKI